MEDYPGDVMAHSGALEAYRVALETYHEAMEARRTAKSAKKYEHPVSTLLKRTSKSKLKLILLNNITLFHTVFGSAVFLKNIYFVQEKKYYQISQKLI